MEKKDEQNMEGAKHGEERRAKHGARKRVKHSNMEYFVAYLVLSFE